MAAKSKRVITGIYSITNKINGKRYIGLSVNIRNRWTQHRSDLRYESHANPHLQSAWNKYGEDNFEFEVLESCDENRLEERELFWIDRFDSCNVGYNILYGAGDYSNLAKGRENTKTFESIVEDFYIFNRYTGDLLGRFRDIDKAARRFDINKYALAKILEKEASYTQCFEAIYVDEYKANGEMRPSSINRNPLNEGFYIVDLISGEYKHFFHIQHGAIHFGIPDPDVISLRLAFNHRPIWQEYWFGSRELFESIGSVESIMDKYGKFKYISDCGLDDNLYSSLTLEEELDEVFE